MTSPLNLFLNSQINLCLILWILLSNSLLSKPILLILKNLKVIYIFSLIQCCFLYFKKVTHNVVNRRSNVQYLKWYKINIIMDICKLLTDCCCRNNCSLLFKSKHYFRFWIPGWQISSGLAVGLGVASPHVCVNNGPSPPVVTQAPNNSVIWTRYN